MKCSCEDDKMQCYWGATGARELNRNWAARCEQVQKLLNSTVTF